MKIATILGARPQFIKAACLSNELLKRKNIEEIIIHTGQHFDKNMSEVFFKEMGIPEPHYNLDINSLSHGAMTGRMLEEIEKILMDTKPDWVVVYGDTNSTIAGALAAKKLHIKVAHIEAGLRSFDMKMPEELNRILTDQISDLLFCPTETAVQNLNNEGFLKKDVKVVNAGDIMYESALFYTPKMKHIPNIGQDFILATLHRQENTNDRQKLTRIIDSFNELTEMGEELIVPLHPRTRKYVEEYGLQIKFKTLDPVGYLEMIYLLSHCKLVLTDSGGLQKEAYFFNKYCLTLRDTTEWVELVDNEVNSLVKIDANLTDTIRKKMNNKIDNSSYLYGMGDTSKIIADNLIHY